MKADLVWYACYGSNLNEDRFSYYIDGEIYPITGGNHAGCRDNSPPRDSDTITIPHSLYFAKSSPSWENKAIAFITSEKVPDSEKHAKCVLYLITKKQFIDILLQENGENPSEFKKPTPNLDALRDGKVSDLGNEKEYTDYGKLLYLGNHENHPIYSFTSKINDEDIDEQVPGGNYLHIIGTGLMDKHKMNPEKAALYLIKQRGVTAGSTPWTYHSLLNLLKEFWVKPTDYRDDPNGHFIAQLNEEDIKSIGLSLTGFKIDILVKNEFYYPNTEKKKEYKYEIPARLHAYDAKKDSKNAKKLNRREIRLDQTIRDAIGVNPGDRIKIGDKKSTWIGFLKWSLGFGKQLNIVRVTRATPTNMEVNICNLEHAAMKSIGIEEGDKIIVESASKKISIRAYGLDSEKIKNRKAEHLENEIYTKFQSLKKVRNSKESLSLIFLDNDARKELGIEVGDPITIYRSNKYAVLKNIHGVTIPLLLAFIGIGANLKEIITLLGIFTSSEASTLGVIQIAYYAFCTLLLIVLNLLPIRNKFK